MNILMNLVNSQKSEVSFKFTSFSDSQENIEIMRSIPCESIVNIMSTMSWKDVQRIILAKKAVDKYHVKKIVLHVPYFLGARSDRDFDENGMGVNYIPDVIAPIINSLHFDQVILTDPHSDVVAACIENSKVQSVLSRLVGMAITSLETKKKVWIVIPDAGAVKRAEKVMQNVGSMFEYEYLFCSKHRDEKTGKLSAVYIPIDDLKGQDCIIVDDLCDGGGTFINLGEELKRRGAGKILLCVAHGIFSKGFDVLSPVIDKVFCSNSFADFKNDILVQHKII